MQQAWDSGVGKPSLGLVGELLPCDCGSEQVSLQAFLPKVLSGLCREGEAGSPASQEVPSQTGQFSQQQTVEMSLYLTRLPEELGREDGNKTRRCLFLGGEGAGRVTEEQGMEQRRMVLS